MSYNHQFFWIYYIFKLFVPCCAKSSNSNSFSSVLTTTTSNRLTTQNVYASVQVQDGRSVVPYMAFSSHPFLVRRQVAHLVELTNLPKYGVGRANENSLIQPFLAFLPILVD